MLSTTETVEEEMFCEVGGHSYTRVAARGRKPMNCHKHPARNSTPKSSAHARSRERSVSSDVRKIAEHWDRSYMDCWSCGLQRKVERCHIVPKALGGTNDPENMVLLCHECHIAAPDVSDPDEMWRWINSRPSILEMLWTTVCQPLKDLGMTDEDAERLMADDFVEHWFADMRNHVVRHWGAGVSYSTYEWICRQLLADTVKELGRLPMPAA